ncbi:hypothetical protein [Streptomyces sp. NPDC050848]|uniref:hypothetical protein n=1 Tax=Streptomyces sp. NPDC050848 TaxID=3155791 RepID=UPI0033C606A1
MFEPSGSGAPGVPVRVDAYGQGAKPRLQGGGARAAVLLENVEQWELRNLDVSNKGAAPGPQERRAGILFRLTDFGTGEHYVVDDVDVHDVNGSDHKGPDPSGGILFVVGGTATPTRFDGITVTDSTVKQVDRTGIATASSWGKRPEHPLSSAPGWAPQHRPDDPQQQGRRRRRRRHRAPARPPRARRAQRRRRVQHALGRLQRRHLGVELR